MGPTGWLFAVLGLVIVSGLAYVLYLLIAVSFDW